MQIEIKQVDRPAPPCATAANVQRTWPEEGNSRIPFWVYSDPEVYRLEKERIFLGPNWSYVALECEIPNAGDYVAVTIGRQPMLMVRAADRAIHVLHNRCANRGVQVIGNLQGNTGAAFVCSAVLALPDGTVRATEGRMPGRLAREPRGGNGFGYDPVLVVEGDTRSAAELSPEEKKSIEAKLTDNLEAYDLYLREKRLISTATASPWLPDTGPRWLSRPRARRTARLPVAAPGPRAPPTAPRRRRIDPPPW